MVAREEDVPTTFLAEEITIAIRTPSYIEALIARCNQDAYSLCVCGIYEFLHILYEHIFGIVIQEADSSYVTSTELHVFQPAHDVPALIIQF